MTSPSPLARMPEHVPQRLRQPLRELTARAARLAPQASTRRVLLFAQGRTGSTLLEQLLASTGHFRPHGEVLGHGRAGVADPAGYVDGLARFHRRTNFTCHVKVYHLDEDRHLAGRPAVDPGRFLRRLHDLGWVVVHLRRDDLVRHALSNIVAEARGRYHQRGAPSGRTTVAVERHQLFHWVRRRTAAGRTEQVALREVPHLELVYERDLRDPAQHQATVDRILDTVDLAHRPVETDLRRINTGGLRGIVENYDEFAAWVGELGLEHHLDDGGP